MGRTKIDCCKRDCPMRHTACWQDCPEYLQQRAELTETNMARIEETKMDRARIEETKMDRAISYVQYTGFRKHRHQEIKRKKQGRK